jgi:O-antigen/teichoic acid export membrane protein
MSQDRSLTRSDLVRNGAATFSQLYQSWRELQQGKRTELPRFLNSLTLIIARVFSSGLGYLTQLITARMYSAAEFGVALGVVSAMMLGVQLALLGVGAAVISLYPQHQSRPSTLLNTAFNIISATSLLTAGLFLVLASAFSHELKVVSASVPYALLFAAICLFGTVNVLFDHVSIATRRGDEVLTRNVLFGIITIAGVGLLPLLANAFSSMTIVLAWVLAGFGACSLGAVQLWRSVVRYRYAPAVDTRLGKNLVTVGLPNYLLTLAERAPNWIIPIIVLELLSKVDNAHWYAVWMMAWVVFIVPISVGQNLFADVVRNPSNIEDAVRHGIRTSLILGILAAAGVGILAHILLGLLGREYAAAGATPLRVLVIAVLPITIIQAYYAVCRATRRLREATLTGVISGLVSVGVMAVVGVRYSLIGMAVAWLAVQFLASLWSVWRLRSIERVSKQASGAT